MEFLKSWTNNLVNTLEVELDRDISEKIIKKMNKDGIGGGKKFLKGSSKKK